MKTLFAALLLVISLAASGQERFYAYKADWSSTTDLKQAAYFMQVVKENDTTYVSRLYNITGPMIRQETFRDEQLSVAMGRFAWYNEKGKIDSTGLVYEGKKHGHWYYFTHPDSSNPTVYEEYNKGRFLERTDLLNKKITNADGSVTALDTTDTTDSTKPVIITQVEAQFPGGVPGWKRYLEKNLQMPDRFSDVVRGNGKATIVVAFNVDTIGNISDVFLHKSVEWSVDSEAMRVIKNGPRWEPARQNGKPVLYRQRQSITFVVN